MIVNPMKGSQCLQQGTILSTATGGLIFIFHIPVKLFLALSKLGVTVHYYSY